MTGINDPHPVLGISLGRIIHSLLKTPGEFFSFQQACWVGFCPIHILEGEKMDCQIWGSQNRTIERLFHSPRGLSTVFGQLSTVWLPGCLNSTAIYGSLQPLACGKTFLHCLDGIHKMIQFFQSLAKGVLVQSKRTAGRTPVDISGGWEHSRG
jgi:hypothetical protein